MGYTIMAGENIKDANYAPYGGALDLMYSHEPEVIIAGPAETGKTISACWKVHLLCSKYPGAQLAIVRKTQKSVYGSVLQTFQRVIAGAPVEPYGGKTPERYLYANGSVVWIGGLDNPDKVLSSERDGIYVNQAEELILNDWELLTTRTTGRSAVVPYPQLFGDANPSISRHWILQRAAAGALRLIKSVHQDNPTLYNRDGTLTEQGTRTLDRLSKLTGMRYKRLYLGEWAKAEGAVFEAFDRDIHVMARNPAEMHFWCLAVDEGYTNPAVVLLIGLDADMRWHVESEFYQTGALQSAVVKVIEDYHKQHRIAAVAVDAAAAGLIADLQNEGIQAKGAKGRVLDRIAFIQELLKVQGDGRPRMTIDPSCVNTINEFESYVWQDNKEAPVKENDHSIDSVGYLATWLFLQEVTMQRVMFNDYKIGPDY